MSNTDFEQLGKDFQTDLKEFIEKSDSLKKNQLHRVIKALAGYPLEEDLVKLQPGQEKEVYELGVQIQSVKLNMMVESLRQDAEEERIKASREAREQREKNKVPDKIEKPDYAEEN